MANKPIYKNPHRTNIVMEKNLFKATNRYLKEQGFRSLSEYFARLGSVDIRRVKSLAHAGSRSLIKSPKVRA